MNRWFSRARAWAPLVTAVALVALLALSACARPRAETASPAPAQPAGPPTAMQPAAPPPLELLEPLPPFPAEEFERRREALMQRMGAGIAVLLGGPAPTTHRRFLQEHNFYYLTGASAHGAALILDARTRIAYLFLPELSSFQRQWEGPRLEPGPEAVRLTGIDSVRPRNAFDGVLRRLLSETDVVYLQHAPPEPPPTSPSDAARAWAEVIEDPWLRLPHQNLRLIELVRERFPDLQIRNLSPLLFNERWVKSSLEADYLRRAGEIGALGVAEAIRSTRPGYYEWEVAAGATFVMNELGEQEIAFAPILASGPNVNIIHYLELDRQIERGDLVVLDYGADYGFYTSDVTRTWPADGRFTPEQLEYYRTVALVRDSVITAMRPGITVPQLTEIAQRIVRRRGHEDVAWPTTRDYIGHFVGMAVHDPGPEDAYTRPFVPGVVFNVEPIIDMPDRDWHFRLEDTVLVTDTGHEVLTDAAPIEPDALARVYAETGVVEWWRGTERTAGR